MLELIICLVNPPTCVSSSPS